jgi:hypothetical protein
MKTNMPPTVLFIGALPPPLGGHPNINERVVNSLHSQYCLVIINLSSGRLECSFAYHFKKIVRVLTGICIDGHWQEPINWISSQMCQSYVDIA